MDSKVTSSYLRRKTPGAAVGRSSVCSGGRSWTAHPLILSWDSGRGVKSRKRKRERTHQDGQDRCILFVAVVNRIVSLIFLSDFLLLLYRHARNFCVLILYPEILFTVSLRGSHLL